MQRLSLCLIGVILFFPIAVNSLGAQQVLRCEGNPCVLLDAGGLTDQLNKLGKVFTQQYSSGFVDGFADAHAMSSIGLQPYIGELSLDSFTLGVKVAAGLDKNSGEDPDTDGTVSAKKIGISGTMLQAFGYGGINLGFLFGFFGAKGDFLDRTDVFIGKLSIKAALEVVPSVEPLKFVSDTSHVSVRYLLIKGAGSAFLARWAGLSFGISYVDSATFVKITKKDKEDSSEFQLGPFLWRGETFLELDSRQHSYSFELNTAFRALYLLTITTGGGIAYNTGRARINFSRDGRLYMDTTDLGVRIIGAFSFVDYLPEVRYYYYRVGTEINLPFTRIGLEVNYVSKDLYGVSLGTRLSF